MTRQPAAADARNEREAHAQLEQSDLRHLHRRAQNSPDWNQGRGPNQPPMRARDVRLLRWVLIGLAVFWACVVAAVARWLS